MLFVANLCETALLLKTVKPMLYLGNVLLLHYVLIYNLSYLVNNSIPWEHISGGKNQLV